MQEQRVTILLFVSTKKIPAEGITREKIPASTMTGKKFLQTENPPPLPLWLL